MENTSEYDHEIPLYIARKYFLFQGKLFDVHLQSARNAKHILLDFFISL